MQHHNPDQLLSIRPGLELDVRRCGKGPPLLLLPGEDGLEAASPFVAELAKSFEVIIPSPPGFGRSNRPDWVSGPDDMAYMMLDLADDLGLNNVPVIGCSFGGWIAAEVATKDDSFIAKLVLIDPYGIKPGKPTERDIQDVWLLSPDEVTALKWHDPANGRRDYTAMPEAELAIVARDRESFARFGWEPYLHNPKLMHRLHRIAVPTLLVWGENDGIVTPRYGEAYRQCIPGARLAVIPAAGHLPHLEQPQAVLEELRRFFG